MCLAWPTVMAFLQTSTHPVIFPNPLGLEQATEHVDALLELPHVRTISEMEGFWAVYREVADGILPRGNMRRQRDGRG